MYAAIIGITSGILTILTILFLKRFDKPVIYGLILSGIGFIYVGFTWTDVTTLVIAGIQALFFLFVAYYGIKSNLYILAAGYFMHGAWDMAFGLLHRLYLIPPGYDLFCLSIDFTMGLYLFIMQYQRGSKAAGKFWHGGSA